MLCFVNNSWEFAFVRSSWVFGGTAFWVALNVRAFLYFRHRRNKIITSNTRTTRITATETPALAPENSSPGCATRVVEPEGAEAGTAVIVVVPLGLNVVVTPGEIVPGGPLRIETTPVYFIIDKGVVGIEETAVNVGVLSFRFIRPRRFLDTAVVTPVMPKNGL
ncbi:uncharacterized protein K444DRAFT_260074 [Hyaloscypha bicolor E]|uniref:Uncharacterized protein n=1 Tax=Hyaloscypha bicolor E TaxID=1095630 RepID=A0A2J6SHB5_9HELO|nr:uncharacterized protein K444DRAFT_260074 [Hyaloscypha bicolor E]PMD50149.1 hypothetical protein K444DRAFT_260074 [Hyaloscypha bicolor E]